MEHQFEVLPLFSSPLVFTIIEDDTDELNNYKNFVRSNIDNISNTASNQNFDDIKRVLEYYPRINNILLERFKEYANQALKYDNDYKITTSWITNTDNGGSAQRHFHKNSLYSGVYYFQDDYPEGCAQLEFTSPVIPLSDFMVCPEESDCGIINSHSWTVTPKPKLLVLFPSYVSHQVLVHKNDKSRRSLAFNIVPLGNYGKGDSKYDHAWIK